jgi:hypothetical protein
MHGKQIITDRESHDAWGIRRSIVTQARGGDAATSNPSPNIRSVR